MSVFKSHMGKKGLEFVPVVHVVQKIGLKKHGAGDGYADIARGQFRTHGFGERNNGLFCHVIRSQFHKGREPPTGGNINDMTASLNSHERNKTVAAVEHAHRLISAHHFQSASGISPTNPQETTPALLINSSTFLQDEKTSSAIF